MFPRCFQDVPKMFLRCFFFCLTGLRGLVERFCKRVRDNVVAVACEFAHLAEEFLEHRLQELVLTEMKSYVRWWG